MSSEIFDESSKKAVLVRRDLLDFEQRLRDNLYQVFSFESHAVYFPLEYGPDGAESPNGADEADGADSSNTPEWLPEEEKLLLPLRRNGELLGIFMAKRPDAQRIPALLPALPGVAALCLDNLALYKSVRTDPLTGLATREVLRERLIQEAELIRAAFNRSPGAGADDERPHAGSMGLIAVRFSGLRDVSKEAGYAFAERLLGELAAAFAAALPEQALAARTGDYTLAALLPEANRLQCENLGENILSAMSQVRLSDPLSGRRMGVQVYAGYALYPQDMDGARLRDRNEHAHALPHKAELAADVARTRAQRRAERHPDAAFPRIMAYGRLLLEGGDIRQILPLARVLVSLGYRVGAREGQRFSVWSEHYAVRGDVSSASEPQALYKGEIVLLEVRESEAVAEVLHLGDPAWPLEPGDMLTLLPGERSMPAPPPSTASVSGGSGDEQGQTTEKLVSHRPDPLTGLLRHGDFLARLAEARNGCRRFALTLLHVDINPASSAAGDASANQAHAGAAARDGQNHTDRPDHLMATLAELCRNAFASSPDQSAAGSEPRDFAASALGGRFGLNSLIFFHPDVDEAEVKTRYAALCAEATERLGLRVGAGIAVWPFLHFRPADMLECSRKALEYALLLPSPHVGVFDSLALNISADKRHCLGDVFGAVEEYKLALLADENNALAWNSLGVCMAGLGRHPEARRHFEEALLRTPDDPALCYNLGAVCQNLGDLEEAATRFHACLELDPGHLYAVIRLGQLAEKAGMLDKAAEHFVQAAGMSSESALPYRHLARLALRRKQPEEAREMLHQALLRNSRDATALMLMANLYLEGGEDPELAESLARQSVAQRPDRKNGWLVLARALETQGRRAEAREARLKAGEL